MAKRKKVVISGPVVETVVYTTPHPNDTPLERAEKSKITRAAQKAMNDKAARRRLSRLIYANFTGDDVFLTLTYRERDLPSKRKTAQADLRKFLKQFRAHRKKRGQELRYIYVTEQRHGDGRLHHHLVFNSTGDDMEVIRSLWTWGDIIDIEPLKAQDFTDWASYMTKESGDRPNGAQMWTGSRNLEKPMVTSWYVNEDETVTAPVGAQVLEQSETTNQFGTYRYIRYKLQ